MGGDNDAAKKQKNTDFVSGCAGPPLPGPVTPALAGERDPKLMPAHELTPAEKELAIATVRDSLL